MYRAVRLYSTAQTVCCSTWPVRLSTFHFKPVSNKSLRAEAAEALHGSELAAVQSEHDRIVAEMKEVHYNEICLEKSRYRKLKLGGSWA